MRLCLANDIKMEASNLGLLYVALSRIEEFSNMVLVEAVDQRRVLYVNTHPGMDGRKKEEERLRGLSYVTVNTYLDLDYEGLLRELDATCNDGIADALQ